MAPSAAASGGQAAHGGESTAAREAAKAARIWGWQNRESGIFGKFEKRVSSHMGTPYPLKS
jgi:hypothetical protein